MLLDGAADDVETSLLRAARLGSSGADQGKVVMSVLCVRSDFPHTISRQISCASEECATLNAVISIEAYLRCIVDY